MEFMLLSDECYPFIVTGKCSLCGETHVLKYFDDHQEVYSEKCPCAVSDLTVVGLFPSYDQWKVERKKQLERSKE